MERKITANFYVTLDGYGEFPEYFASNFSPPWPDLFFSELWTSRYEDADTIIMGRRSFEGHQKVHSLAGRKPDDPYYMFDYSRFLEGSNKILLSRTVKETSWGRTRIMSGRPEEIAAQLKSEPGKNIILEGGPAVVRDWIEKDLIDEFRMAIWPVIFGRGPAYWPKLESTQRNLRLVSAKTLSYGELILRYERDRRPPETPATRGDATRS